MKTFFSLNRSKRVTKNQPFYTDFKNVHLTSVKSTPKKVCPKNRFSNRKKSQQKTVFWTKLFLGCTISKVKCSSHRTVNVYFLWTKKSPKCRNPSKFCKTVFFNKQVLDFHRPSKIFFQTSRRQNHWSRPPKQVGDKQISLSLAFFTRNLSLSTKGTVQRDGSGWK